MYLIVIVWTYVTLMMAVAEATSPVGTVLGAIITFVLYGVLPMGILVYILGTPSRKRKIKAREAAAQAEYDAQQAQAHEKVLPSDDGVVSGGGKAPPSASVAPYAGGEAPGAAEHSTVAPVRKEP